MKTDGVDSKGVLIHKTVNTGWGLPVQLGSLHIGLLAIFGKQYLAISSSSYRTKFSYLMGLGCCANVLGLVAVLAHFRYEKAIAWSEFLGYFSLLAYFSYFILVMAIDRLPVFRHFLVFILGLVISIRSYCGDVHAGGFVAKYIRRFFNR